MRLLGIDPGSRKAGWGVVEVDAANRRVVYVASGILRLNCSAELPDRIVELSRGLLSLVEQWKPTCSVIEDIFVGDHARAALYLGQARGAVLAVLGLSNISVVSISATAIKQTITGNGHASKNQVGQMLVALLQLKKQAPEDASDALAAALCHGIRLANPTIKHMMPPAKKLSHRQNRKELEKIAARHFPIFD